MDNTTNRNSERQAKQLEEEFLDRAKQGDFGRVRQLVQVHRVNVNCTDHKGWTPLMHAAHMGRIQVGRFLLQNDADAHAEDRHGWTALVCAVWCGNVAMAQLLLQHGANIENQIHSGSYTCSLLGKAISSRNVAMVELLLRFRANTQETLYDGEIYTALYLACWKSNLRIVQLLINHEGGANVNAFIPRDHYHRGVPAMSPLCKACKNNNLEMVQLLIQHGARVIYNGVYPDVPCPLVPAVEHETTALLRFLLDHSRFLDPANEENAQVPQIVGDNHPLSPALEATIEGNKLEAAQLLMERGASVNNKPFLWQCANYEPHCWTAPRDCRIGIVRRLLRAGAHVNHADRETGQTPLWAAAKNGHVAIVKELLKARANVRIRDSNNGETPLGVAYRQGDTDIVYLLLRTSPHVWSNLAAIW